MRAFLRQLGISLTLHRRNTMALTYSYLFPMLVFVAFAVLYRHEQVPMARHMGELLTITVLGGACFGLPTSMVSERERGVWRRYRLAPVRIGSLVLATVSARYVLLIAAGVLQLVLAMAIGMPAPRHPLDLWLAFTCVSFAFLGLGLVIAVMADSVPAVQALGQCIFLPMLIIGGVAVPLASLPDWAQRVSMFFPGRYAVDALQTSVTGSGLGAAGFSAIALLIIGAAGSAAGANMFRWDAQQRFMASEGKAWVGFALAAWIAVGLLAEARGRSAPASPATAVSRSTPTDVAAPTAVTGPPSTAAGVATPPPLAPHAAPGPAKTLPAPRSAPVDVAPAATGRKPEETIPTPGNTKGSWQSATGADIERDLIFTRLPPDGGIVTPIARPDEEPAPEFVDQLDQLAVALADWDPGQVPDPVQRVRNFLYVPAVADVFQMEGLERQIPRIVFDRIQQDIPKDDLIKILYWIALHPMEGDDSAVDELRPLGLGNGPSDMETTRARVGIYAVKLLGRLTGKF
jgi:ABC-2 type transporter